MTPEIDGSICGLLFMLLLFGIPLAYMIGMLRGDYLAQRWWEKELVRRGHGTFDAEHNFHWNRTPMSGCTEE